MPRNQTATVDVSRSTVTYYITSRSNRSAIVLYDSQHVSVLRRILLLGSGCKAGKRNLLLFRLHPQHRAELQDHTGDKQPQSARDALGTAWPQQLMLC